MASIYRRGEIWWVAYYVGDELRRKSLKTSNKRIAEREKQALEAKLLEPHFEAVSPKNPRVEEFWAAYAEWAKDHKRQSSCTRTAIFWEQLMEYSEARRVGDISSNVIEGFKRARKALGNSEQTVNNGLRELKAVFNRGKKLGLYSGPNPVIGVSHYPMSQNMPDFHTREQLDRLLEVAKGHGHAVHWSVLLCSLAGLRKAEVACCRWEWFDFDPKHPTIHVRNSHGFEIKDRDERVIPMNRRIYDELFSHRHTEGYVLPHRRKGGNQRYRLDLRRSLFIVLREAGLPTDKPYQRLRHTFGSLLAQKGVSIFKVSKWMGHSSVQVTERHYAGLQSYDPEIDSL
jgi:integrase